MGAGDAKRGAGVDARGDAGGKWLACVETARLWLEFRVLMSLFVDIH